MESTQYRCSACGNLTRFDVVKSSTVREFHHFSVGGEDTIEEIEVLSLSIDSVTCRWCGHGKAIETIAKSTELGADSPPTERVE